LRSEGGIVVAEEEYKDLQEELMWQKRNIEY
jgi:hypothetical protein